jgi:predicted nicotinamide N-methyase
VLAGLQRIAVPFVPEITLATAEQPWELWDASGRDAPPFWAFPWGGGQGLARYVLDNPELVAGRRVLDVASGSGLVAIAAAKSRALTVTATDIDPDALDAIRENAAANGVAIDVAVLDLGIKDATTDATKEAGGAQVVLAADVFYQREFAALALSFLKTAARHGAEVVCADPGRAFVPAGSLEPIASYEVPVLTAIENVPVKTVTVYRLPERAS